MKVVRLFDLYFAAAETDVFRRSTSGIDVLRNTSVALREGKRDPEAEEETKLAN